MASGPWPAVVLLSGGIDSTTALAIARRDGATVDPASLVGGPVDQVVTFRSISLPDPLPAMPPAPPPAEPAVRLAPPDAWTAE